MKTVRNKTKQEQVVIGYGTVKPGASIEVSGDFENPNFEETGSKSAPASGKKDKVDG